MKILCSALLLPGHAPCQGKEFEIENDQIAWRGVMENGTLRPSEVKEDEAGGSHIALNGACFELVLGDDTHLTSADFKLEGSPRIESLTPDAKSPKLSSRESGHVLSAHFSAPDAHLTADWRVLLRKHSSYVRQELTLRAAGGTCW